jgi:hypothetical protein
MRRIAACLPVPAFSCDRATCDTVIIGNKINARTTDRDLSPKDSVKNLGLLKINLLPKKYHPCKEIFIKLRSTQPPVLRIDQTYDNRVYNKISNIAREKLIYINLADNIQASVCQIGKFGQTKQKIVIKKRLFYGHNEALNET